MNKFVGMGYLYKFCLIRVGILSLDYSEKSDWDNHLPYVMMAYRATVQESTRCTPNHLPYAMMAYRATVLESTRCTPNKTTHRHNVWCCK